MKRAKKMPKPTVYIISMSLTPKDNTVETPEGLSYKNIPFGDRRVVKLVTRKQPNLTVCGIVFGSYNKVAPNVVIGDDSLVLVSGNIRTSGFNSYMRKVRQWNQQK